jgi:hypothetical protein
MQIGVLSLNQKTTRWSRYGGYVFEILAHAGFPYLKISLEELSDALPGLFVLIIPTQTPLTPEVQKQIGEWVASGHILVACGGVSTLEDLLGCRSVAPLREAWVGEHSVEHPITKGLSGALHAFGGYQIEAGADVEVLASWLDGSKYNAENGWQDALIGPAITLRHVGQGAAVLIAADLVHSIVRIQQGKPIHVDAEPDSAGTALVNDGILKTDDGLVLDYDIDRQPIANTRFFGRGIADEWREVLLRSILWGAAETHTALPMLWYWPNQLQAVGLISHDSDGNDPALADVLLANLQALQIPSSWCVQYPGGYAPAFYKKLVQLGYEICLHYDAFTQKGRAFWGEANFRMQLDWLRDMAGAPVVSNKNHYLRWEGLDEFFVWLENAGVTADQTKGPSKTGNTGFPFGGSHPWFPIQEHTLRMIDVLEINLSTQDIALTCPLEIGPACVDWAKAHYGIAHFLFHPAHAAKPHVAEAMRTVVNYGKEEGLPWWTCNQIANWERARRQVRFHMATEQGGASVWSMTSAAQVPGATLVWFGEGAPKLDGASEPVKVSVYGFPATMQVVDLQNNQTLILQ